MEARGFMYRCSSSPCKLGKFNIGLKKKLEHYTRGESSA